MMIIAVLIYAALVLAVGYLACRLFAVGKWADRALDETLGRDESEGAHGR